MKLLIALALICLCASTPFLKKELKDDATFSNIDTMITTHQRLSLELDFNNKKIDGTNTISLIATDNMVLTGYLDVRGIDIKGIKDQNGVDLDWKINDLNPKLGAQLEFEFNDPLTSEQGQDITITYSTNDEQTATSWLNPEQTAGKKKPYMFTQCESIHCRSIAPMQDTPAVKSTYELEIITPKDIESFASGNLTDTKFTATKKKTYFRMDIPVESYLIAIAAGDLTQRQVGPRTYVISEPSEIDKCSSELDDLETGLKTAESFLIPYEWGDYKILILPPAFPFGGMENPLLTFASPSIIVGDKSNVFVANHEIAHSWTGNLVTNMNWDNFWLNEGFTVYSERKITKILQGETFYKVASKVGNSSMYSDMVSYGMKNSYSSLTPKCGKENPDDAFSTIPYEKGFQFLVYLETLVGENNFQKFLQGYLIKFQRQSITVDDLKGEFNEFVYANFENDEAKRIVKEIDWTTWIEKPGLPPVTADFDTPEMARAQELATQYVQLNGTESPEGFTEYNGWFMFLQNIFIDELLAQSKDLNPEIIAKIDEDLNISGSLNAELKAPWIQAQILAGAVDAPFADADNFLGTIGRMKFIVPIYVTLASVAKDDALRIYEGHRAFYHPIALDTLDKALGLKEASEENVYTYKKVIY